MRRPIVDPRISGRIISHWPSLCTIQQKTYTISESNQQVPTGYSSVPGMVNIACRMSPIIHERPTDNEQRGDSISSQTQTRTVKLNGFYPLIETGTMQVSVDGVQYQIRGVESDSERYSTRLRVEKVIPNG